MTKTKQNKKGEIIRSSFLESSTFLVSFPVGISRQNVSLQLISKLTMKKKEGTFPLNSTCQLRVITTIRHPQQF